VGDALLYSKLQVGHCMGGVIFEFNDTNIEICNIVLYEKLLSEDRLSV